MSKAIERYLNRRAVGAPWVVESAQTQDVDQIVVIPCFAEYDHLFDTLDDLAKNDAEILKRSLVLCVINNRSASVVDPQAIENNQRCLLRLREAYLNQSPLRLALIDATSPGKELPLKGGVGLARKIGLDNALRILAENGRHTAPLISLDADTRVQENYLSAVVEFFQEEDRWAAVVEYEHPLVGDPLHVEAMASYEIYLRYHCLGLHYAHSPYPFHTIGSTILCTAQAYAAVSGMNRRQAGEDFYFLQQLAKTGSVDHLRKTIVYPSSRVSKRVPFGTGASIGRHVAGEEKGGYLYHPQSYHLLRRWSECVQKAIDQDASLLLKQAGEIDAALKAFFLEQDFTTAWQGLQKNHKGRQQRLKAWATWFDGFRILKAIHYLRDHGYPQQAIREAVDALMQGIPGSTWRPDAASGLSETEARLALLNRLRRVSRRPYREIP